MHRRRLLSLRSTTGAEPPSLARKPNYDFEKRRKEMDRKAKKDAKREDRARRRSEGLPDEPAEPVEPGQEGDASTTT